MIGLAFIEHRVLFLSLTSLISPKAEEKGDRGNGYFLYLGKIARAGAALAQIRLILGNKLDVVKKVRFPTGRHSGLTVGGGGHKNKRENHHNTKHVHDDNQM